MSEGKNFISSVLRDADVASLMEAPVEYFIDDEKALYEYVISFYRQYRSLPSRRALGVEGFTIPTTEEPVEYYKARCLRRAMYIKMVDGLGGVNNLIKDYNSAEALALLKQIVTETEAIQGQSAITTLAMETNVVMTNYNNRRFGLSPVSVMFGIPYLDDMTGGMQPADLSILAARPNMGKSQILLRIAKNVWEAGKKTLLISMEMSLEQIARRLMSLDTCINPKLIREGEVSSHSHETMLAYVASLQEKENLYLVAGDFSSRLRDIESYITSCSPEIVFIDAGYLLKPDSTGFKSRHETIASVIEGLKNMARRYNIPIFTTVQINREGAKRKNIGLENLAETDTIGQLSSVAMVLNYGREPNEKTTRKITVIKNRDGEIGLPFYVNFSFSPVNVDFIGVEGEETSFQGDDLYMRSFTD